MIKNKRGSALIWIIVILVIIAIGVGIYFWISGGDSSPAVNAGTSAGSSIPQPPALPSG